MTTILCILGFALLAILGYKKPFFALAIIAALLPTYLIRSQFFGLPTTMLECMVLGFLAGVIASKPDWKIIKQLGKINYAIGIFILAGIIGVITSPEKISALGQLKAFIIEPILFFYGAYLVTTNGLGLKEILKGLMLGSGAVSLFGIIQYFTFLWLPIRFWGTGDEPTRITSIFEYPNALALYLAPLFVLFFVLWQKRYEIFKYLYTYHWYFLITGIALILTQSRGAWAAVISIVLIALFKNSRHLPTLLTGILIAILAVFIIPSTQERILSSFADKSSLEHKQLLFVGVNKLILSPIFGNGLAGFETTLNQSDFSGRPVSYPHNIFLNFWLELGLLGLVAFAGLLYESAKRLTKNQSTLAIAGGAMVLSIIIHGLVDVPYFKNDLAILFWIAILLIYSNTKK